MCNKSGQGPGGSPCLAKALQRSKRVFRYLHVKKRNPFSLKQTNRQQRGHSRADLGALCGSLSLAALVFCTALLIWTRGPWNPLRRQAGAMSSSLSLNLLHCSGWFLCLYASAVDREQSLAFAVFSLVTVRPWMWKAPVSSSNALPMEIVILEAIDS